MHTLAPTVATVKPATIGDQNIPFTYGEQDARNGLGCCPEMYFVQRVDQRDYARGWVSVRGHNDTTRYFLGGNK